MPTATFTVPCTHTACSQAVNKDPPLLGYRFLFTGTSFRRCGGSSSAQTCPAFFIICRRWTELPRARWEYPGYVPALPRHPQPPAGRQQHPGQHRLVWGHCPGGGATSSTANTTLMLLSSHSCHPAVAGFHASFKNTSFQATPLLFVCFEAPKSL